MEITTLDDFIEVSGKEMEGFGEGCYDALH